MGPGTWHDVATVTESTCHKLREDFQLKIDELDIEWIWLLDGWIAERVYCLGGLMHSFKKHDNIRCQQLLGSRTGIPSPLVVNFWWWTWFLDKLKLNGYTPQNGWTSLFIGICPVLLHPNSIIWLVEKKHYIYILSPLIAPFSPHFLCYSQSLNPVLVVNLLQAASGPWGDSASAWHLCSSNGSRRPIPAASHLEDGLTGQEIKGFLKGIHIQYRETERERKRYPLVICYIAIENGDL